MLSQGLLIGLGSGGNRRHANRQETGVFAMCRLEKEKMNKDQKIILVVDDEPLYSQSVAIVRLSIPLAVISSPHPPRAKNESW
ncbi:MAG: hypothetical protein JMN27_13485 [gamma proteobacterium endosymbiont of Lamellibrachia anaximandri]|nr:hypothetical protein [gamma proteobacterium endosymbiont of Lamellibrachia anaximandri]MBL3534827.1 hypothetical protein [gamma proteobacterium endosymbiont of Lamellibrachia anaximandri]